MDADRSGFQLARMTIPDLPRFRLASVSWPASSKTSPASAATLRSAVCVPACHWLGERGDAENRVAAHRSRVVERQSTERLHMNIFATAHERDEPGHLLAFNVTGEDAIHSLKTRLRQSCWAHGRIEPLRC